MWRYPSFLMKTALAIAGIFVVKAAVTESRIMLTTVLLKKTVKIDPMSDQNPPPI